MDCFITQGCLPGTCESEFSEGRGGGGLGCGCSRLAPSVASTLASRGGFPGQRGSQERRPRQPSPLLQSAARPPACLRLQAGSSAPLSRRHPMLLRARLPSPLGCSASSSAPAAGGTPSAPRSPGKLLPAAASPPPPARGLEGCRRRARRLFLPAGSSCSQPAALPRALLPPPLLFLLRNFRGCSCTCLPVEPPWHHPRGRTALTHVAAPLPHPINAPSSECSSSRRPPGHPIPPLSRRLPLFLLRFSGIQSLLSRPRQTSQSF